MPLLNVSTRPIEFDSLFPGRTKWRISQKPFCFTGLAFYVYNRIRFAYHNYVKRPHVAPGNRVVVRDAEWLVTGTRSVRNGHQILECVGLSEIVKDDQSIFLTELEEDIAVLDPGQTRLVPDDSSNYAKSRLYLETLFRNSAPSGNEILVGHKGAMDVVDYQLEPTRQALSVPRVRLLIADAVGLGKTIEAGILLSELMQRGRAKRILVVAVKSMLTQFQKELWARFTIPLVRLDSEGIQKIRRDLPSNYNPFSYYDRTIVSMDTLKRDADYRFWIEQSRWDVVVIDEAHNVAKRGSGAMRHRLADRLADRCDSMILLSATPHDGRPESFASLMNMLNPTAISDVHSYTKDDIKGLFIRRHKHDIRHQVLNQFQDRTIRAVHVPATDGEERAFDAFLRLDLESDRRVRESSQARGGRILFKTQIEKALFSSIPACVDTIRNRIKRLQDGTGVLDYPKEINSLEDFAHQLGLVSPENTAKYRKLLAMLKGDDQDFSWRLKDSVRDRVVIFTERIHTMRWLAEQLRRDLGMDEKSLRTISGFGMSDMDQQEVVEAFGKERDPVRILVASDVASEGINLHYLSHRMVHYDVPWSLMTFQQRNGRIDRYGQEQKPEIWYLLTESENETIRGDMRVLQLLIEKDRHVHENIGDPGEFTGRYEIEEDEEATAAVIQDHLSPADAEKALFQETEDFLKTLFGSSPDGPSTGDDRIGPSSTNPPTVFGSDYAYYTAALSFLSHKHNLQIDTQPDGKSIVVTRPEGFSWRERFLPREVIPEDHRWRLTVDRNAVQKEIAEARKEESAWPRQTLLWDHHPMASWLRDSITAVFGRHEAPVIVTPFLKEGESRIILTGMVPNQAGQTVLQRWISVPAFRDGAVGTPVAAAQVLHELWKPGSQVPNPGSEATATYLPSLQALLPAAVDRARQYMNDELQVYRQGIAAQISTHQQELRRLKNRRVEQLELDLVSRTEGLQGRGLKDAYRRKADQERERIDRIFSSWFEWIEHHVQLEDDPFILVAGVFTA